MRSLRKGPVRGLACLLLAAACLLCGCRRAEPQQPAVSGSAPASAGESDDGGVPLIRNGEVCFTGRRRSGPGGRACCGRADLPHGKRLWRGASRTGGAVERRAGREDLHCVRQSGYGWLRCALGADCHAGLCRFGGGREHLYRLWLFLGLRNGGQSAAFPSDRACRGGVPGSESFSLWGIYRLSGRKLCFERDTSQRSGAAGYGSAGADRSTDHPCGI